MHTGEDGNIPRACAEKFEEISEALGRICAMARDVRKLREAVIGNGRAETSLVFRLRKLEEASEATCGRRRRGRERVWRIVVATGLIVFGWWLKSD